MLRTWLNWKNCPPFKIHFLKSKTFCHLSIYSKWFCTKALLHFQVNFLMIKWHIDQFVDFYVIFSLCLAKYYQIFARDNKRHHMFKVLNYGCSYPLIDDYTKYKICGPINVTSFPIMAFILQLTHGYSKYKNH
jgi:hypothetical protein